MRLLLFFILFSNCFVAKKSLFDFSKPSSSFSFLIANLPKSSSGTENTSSPILESFSYSASKLVFYSNGSTSSSKPSSQKNYTSWSISPNLPSTLSFNTSTGEITCSCLLNTPYFIGNFEVLAISTSSTDKINISIEVISNFQIIDGNLVNGLGGNSNLKDAPFPISYNNKLYIFFQESNRVRAVVWSGNGYTSADWSYIDGGTNLNVNNVIASAPSATLHNGFLFVSWSEQVSGSDNRVILRRFDGTTWTTIQNGVNSYINPSITNSISTSPIIHSFNSTLYLVYSQNGNIITMNFNGSIWNTSSTFTPPVVPLQTSISTYNSNMYLTVALNGNPGTVIYSSPIGIWTNLSNLNNSLTSTVGFPSMTTLNNPPTNTLYITWHEFNGTSFQIRGRSYDGTSFQFIDGSSTNSNIPINSSNSSLRPEIFSFQNKIYFAFSEASKLRGRIYDPNTNTYTSPGYSPNFSLNYDFSNSAVSNSRPRFVIHENRLIITWEENNRIRVMGFFN